MTHMRTNWRWLRQVIDENITVARHRNAELQAEIRQAQGITK
jgi:hypothetical protein